MPDFLHTSNGRGARVRHSSGRMLLPTDTGARTRGDLLLTGSTGFLGMELLARLLEDTDRRVWAPVRAGDDAEAEARLRATLTTLLPDPDMYSERVVAFAADLTQPGLGLEARRRDEIAEQVSEIIHSAASVSFTLPLEEARAINVAGTRRMLELAADCQAHGGLTRYAHVSTAYVAGDHKGDFSEDDHDLGQDFNNTYERSKWEAERLVRERGRELPVQVFRPSIVVGHERSGWTASFNVIYTPLRMYARGALPLIPARRSAPVDIVPVSYVARAILALDDAGAGRTFNLVAGPDAPTMAELIDLTVSHFDGPPIRTVSPAVYRRTVEPVLVRRATSAQKRWIEQTKVFFPYFSSAARFRDDATREALEPHGVQAPPLGDYFGRLVDYAVGCRWGGRKVGRAQARAAAAV
jgi:thioester reductase-like protein